MGNARTWNALFQQRPAPESGDYFRAEWLKPYDTPPDPDEMHIYGASDYAVSTDRGDFTVHIVVGVDPNGHLYILDLWRAQASADIWVEAMTDLVARWKPLGWAEEGGQIRAGIGPFLVKRLAEKQLYIARAQFPTKGDKSIRAQSIRGRVAMNGLYYPRNAPWFPTFKAELMSFPAGRYDDQVDALGLLGQVLDKMIGGNRKDTSSRETKVISTDPNVCNVTLTDMFEANEGKAKFKTQRIA
jgi:predicted phage terminase large subunit-like protein